MLSIFICKARIDSYHSDNLLLIWYEMICSLDDYQKAFRKIDIRGIYEQEIDDGLGYVMGRVIGKKLVEQATSWQETTLLIGSDTRYHNNNLIPAFVAWLQAVWFDNFFGALFTPQVAHPEGKINDFGVCSSSAMYWIAHGTFDYAVAFTASHNTAEYTWMKIIDKNTVFIPPSDLWNDFVREYNILWDDFAFVAADDLDIALHPSIGTKKENLFHFLQKKFSTLDKYHHFVVDYSNGAAVSIEREFLWDRMENHRIEHLNDYPDGTFPAHEADPSAYYPAHYDGAKIVMNNTNAEFVAMFDGDGDRVWFMDENGRVVSGDIITAIIAKQLLVEYADDTSFSKTIVHDVMSSKIIDDVAQEQWWDTHVSPMGRLFINHDLMKLWWLFGGEVSAHYMFGTIGWYELVLLALYYVMKELEKHSSFSAMIQSFTRYYTWPLTNIKVADNETKERIITKIRDAYMKYSPQAIDGVNVFTDDFQLCVRKSNTEPVIRISVEAQTHQAYVQILQDIMDLVNGES